MQIRFIIAVIVSVVFLVGCGVSQEDYDKLNSKYQKLVTDNSELIKELDELKNGEAKIIGKIESGNSEQVTIYTGILNIGEVSGIPIIKELLQKDSDNVEIIIIDCPPGSACIVMESIKVADFCILVAEPTLFGCHNLKMVHELVNVFDKKYGVILNKCVEGVNPAEVYCNENEIKILGKIMFDPELGLINSQGLIATRISEKYKNFFRQLLSDIIKEVRHETNVDS